MMRHEILDSGGIGFDGHRSHLAEDEWLAQQKKAEEERERRRSERNRFCAYVVTLCLFHWVCADADLTMKVAITFLLYAFFLASGKR